MDNSTLDDHLEVFTSKYANSTFLERAISSFVDSIILAVPNLLLFFLLKNLVISSIVSHIISITYYTLMESSSRQATIGKMIYTMKVVDYNYQRISLSRSLSRTLIKYAGSIFYVVVKIVHIPQAGSVATDSFLLSAMGIMLAITLVDDLFALTNNMVQALHDKLAGTYVMKQEVSL